MATATGNYVCDNSSLTNFKSWAQAISNAFSAFGWLQTSDTGQVNWSTIAAVPSGYVYEVWKANDAQAGTMPIYVKIEYGSSTTNINIRVTVGTGSNGAGTITGVTISGTPWQFTNNLSNQGATTFPCFFSGDAGEFRMYMWSTAASPWLGTFLVIERSKDNTGAKTSGYVTALVGNQGNTSSANQQSFSSTNAGNRDTGIICVALTTSSGTGASFGTVAAFPVFPIIGQIGNPMLGIMACVAADVANGSTVTVASMYGSTHTYIGMVGNQLAGTFAQRSSNGAAMAGLIRYE